MDTLDTTIKQLADRLGTSKTTISKIIKKLEIEPLKQMVNNQVLTLLTDEECEAITADYLKRHPTENPTTNDRKGTTTVSGNGVQGGAMGGDTHHNTIENNADKSFQDSTTVGAMQQTIEILREQLAQKDKQIDDLTRLLDQQQRLALVDNMAETKQAQQTDEKPQEMAYKEVEEPPQEENNKKWYEFWK